jgi:integrase
MTVKVREYKKPGKKGWEVDIQVRFPNGERFRERVKAPVTGSQAALRWGQERETVLIRDGGPKGQGKEVEQAVVEVKPAVPTLREFCPRYLETCTEGNRNLRVRRQKFSTVTTKKCLLETHIVPVLGDKRLDEINDDEVNRLEANLGKASDKSVNNVLCVVSHLLKVAVGLKVIPAMPTHVKLRAVTPSTDLEFYEFEDYERLISAAAKADPRVLVFVLLGGDAGLREGEILEMKWTDVDFRRGIITVSRAVWRGEVSTPKGGRGRRVPMTEKLAAALKSLRHLRGPHVLCNEDGRPVDSNLARRWMMRAQRLAGMEVNGKKHILRHTFCSHLAMRGAPAIAIKELAGHVDLSTTSRYMHLSPNEKDRAIRLLDQGRTTPTTGEMLETGSA